MAVRDNHSEPLDQILLLQSLLPIAQDLLHVGQLCCATLGAMPGVHSVGFRSIEDEWVAVSDRKGNQSITLFAKFEQFITDRFTASLHSRSVEYGSLVFLLDRPEEFSAVRPYVENTANLAALVLENLQQRSDLTSVNHTLETKVKNRTNHLVRVMDDLKIEKTRLKDSRDQVARQNMDLIHAMEDLVSAKEAIERSNDELMQFSYRTSHDLKAPLITSKRLADFVVQDIVDGNLDEAKLNSKKIVNQMGRLEVLVGDILSLAKVGIEKPERTEVDFAEILILTSDHLSTLIEESGCHITQSIKLSSPVFGETIRYAQIIENLVSNGIKYRDTNKDCNFVNVDIRDTEDQILISIEDNGIGIPEHNQADVFKMFKRFHPSVSFGSGLGMSIAKKHIISLGGDVEFKSSADGTNFKITIPKGANNEANAHPDH